jgi:SAM-dependent methyltransferase
MTVDPLSGSAWSNAATVAGFAQSAPNATLLDYARRVSGGRSLRIADLGCGAGRNAVPLAAMGARVVALDLSLPMVVAAQARVAADQSRLRLVVALAPMDALPLRDRSIDLIVAHGIWNLARSDAEWRRAVREAARVAAAGARLFAFTFSRHTIPPGAQPVAGEQFAFTDFSGSPQIFMTADQLITELAHEGFEADPALPIREHNLPPAGQPRISGPPVIYEAGFIFRGA